MRKRMHKFKVRLFVDALTLKKLKERRVRLINQAESHNSLYRLLLLKWLCLYGDNTTIRLRDS